MEQIIKPPKLNKGDTIGLVSPSCPLAGLVKHRVNRAIKQLKEMGFKVKLGQSSLAVSGYTAGSAKERAKDINTFFKDDEVKAIISFIGGNHSNQLLEYIDFDLIRKNPKIFIGYSDVTVLHLSLLTKANLTTFYGPSALNQLAENPKILDYTREYLFKATMSSRPIGAVIPSKEWTDEVLDWFTKADQKRPRKMKKNIGWEWLKDGGAKGPMIGGCISSLMHLRGTEFWPNFSNAIFFWETSESANDFSKGEPIDLIDALLTDLRLSGVFDKIGGMVVGRPFGYSEEDSLKLKDLIIEKTKKYNFPILFGADFGHTDPMITIPIGVTAKLNSKEDKFEIIESCVV